MHKNRTATAAVFERLRLAAADAIGHPARIVHLLASMPPPSLAAVRTTPSIDGQRVPQWQMLSDGPTSLTGFAPDGHRAVSTRIDVPELADLITARESIEDVDIRDVGLLSASKSPLGQYTSLCDFARERCASLLGSETREAIEGLLAHSEIRIGLTRASDVMQRASWDGRIELSNAGGSHHFAAAHLLAHRLGVARRVRCRFVYLGVNPSTLHRLMDRFSVFLVPHTYVGPPWVVALQALGVTWYWLDAPPPLWAYRLLLFPQDNPRSCVAARCLDDAGFPWLTDALAAAAYNGPGSRGCIHDQA